MQITSSQYKHCDLLTLEGRIDSLTSPQFSEAITKITDEGRYRIVLDMAGVVFISSAGLRVLINAQKDCRRYNRGEVVLSSVPEKVYAALDLAGFTSLFKTFSDALTAVGSF